jgi:hypothetical protein
MGKFHLYRGMTLSGINMLSFVPGVSHLYRWLCIGSISGTNKVLKPVQIPISRVVQSKCMDCAVYPAPCRPFRWRLAFAFARVVIRLA